MFQVVPQLSTNDRRMRLSNLQNKIIENKQKKNFSKKAQLLHFPIEEMILEFIYCPKDDLIKNTIRENMLSQMNKKNTFRLKRFINHEMVNFFAESKRHSEKNFFCIFPEMFSYQEKEVEFLPCIKISPISIMKIYDGFIKDSSFDFFAFVSEDFAEGIAIDSYADYPSESNNFYDGPVYEVFSW